jgi:hypothetical protein
MVSRSTSLRCEEVAQGQYCTGESKYALQGTPDRPHLPPPPPFLFRTAGEEGGDYAARTFPLAPSPHTLGAEEGGWERSSGNSTPVSYNDAAATITPLPQRGRGAGGEGRPHLPPCPVSSHIGSGRGGMGAEQRQLCACVLQRCRGHHHPSPAARERGRG